MAAQALLIRGRRFEFDSPDLAAAIASAHASRHRPRCLCLVDGIEMYVARLGDGFIVKRMPDSGSHHAPDCPSYEPPAEFSGLGQVFGSAISEDPATGVTALKLGFSMSRIGGRSSTPSAGGVGDSVATDGTKLSLRGLLHYLWDQAELTRWHPGFAGKRSWATVRRQLLAAAENKIARGGALADRIYVPEVFTVEQRDAINARRIAQLMHARASHGAAQNLMLLIGEVKEIVPARYGFKAVVKHVPDQAFALDEKLYRRMGTRFDRELSLWSASDNLHMVMIATFSANAAGVPAIEALSLMPTTAQWLPVEDSFEVQLIDRLVQDGRRFAKGMRYNLASEWPLPAALLLDTSLAPFALHIAKSETVEPALASEAGVDSTTWVWVVGRCPMPPIPPRVIRRHLGATGQDQSLSPG